MKKYELLYNSRLDKLKQLCGDSEISVDIVEGHIEYIAVLTGGGQMNIFGENNESRIIIATALDTRVQSEGDIDIEASHLKKIIKLVENAAQAYFLFERERIYADLQVEDSNEE